jgi:hypothetical protein
LTETQHSRNGCYTTRRYNVESIWGQHNVSRTEPDRVLCPPSRFGAEGDDQSVTQARGRQDESPSQRKSSISVIQECLRKAQYLLDEKWKPGVEGPGLTFGSAIHAALETYYCGDPALRILPKFDDCEAIAFGHLPANPGLIQQAMIRFVEKAQPLAGLPDGDKRSIPNGLWILHEYFRAYIADPYITYIDDHGPFIERKFSHRIFEDGRLVIEIFGTIDFAFQSTVDGRILTGDHKTASSLGYGGQSYYDRDKPNHQYTGYVLGAQKEFGFESDEFLVNVIEVKAKPKTARGQGVSFPRQITRRDEHDFDEYRDVVMETVERYLHARETGKWSLGPVGACNSYGACSYKSVCSAPHSLRQNILAAKFIKEI